MADTPLGFGAGLRRAHYAEIFADPALAQRIDWFEVISENFMVDGGKALAVLERVRETHPIVTHGVSLSIGSADPLDETYLRKLARLVERVKPAIVSDHLCWTSTGGKHAHDLLPLPFAGSEVERIADRVRHVQDVLGRRILLENVSSYVAWEGSAMPEWEFLASIAEKADCGILLDVNNVWVSARNHGFDPHAYLAGIPPARVGQLHLAGHSDRGGLLLDTHDAPVPDPVWALYREAVARFGSDVPTLIEWDDKLPPFSRLVAEVAAARHHAQKRHPRDAVSAEKRNIVKYDPTDDATDVAEGQRVFLGAIVAPEGPGAMRARLAEIGVAVERAEVYANMYFARLHDALREDFPAVFAAIGAERFHDLATDYLWLFPSESWTLRDLGARLPAFLRAPAEKTTFTRALVTEIPWLADLAALEWARVEAFDAADAAAMEPAALAGVSPEQWESLVLTPHPSLRIVSAGSRVDAAWKEADEGRSPSAPAPARGALRVWRDPEHVVWHAWIDPLEARLLSRLREGATLGAVCEDAASELAPDEAARTVVALLRTWLADALLAR